MNIAVCVCLVVAAAPMTMTTMIVTDCSGLVVAYLTAVREVLGSHRAVGSCVYRTTTAIYSLGHVLCARFLQCLGQLGLLPSVGR